MSTMRYNAILDKKIEIEKTEDDKQQKLREKAGVTDETVTVKHNTGKMIFHHVLLNLLGVIRYVLAAIGILTLLEPTIRAALIATIAALL